MYNSTKFLILVYITAPFARNYVTIQRFCNAARSQTGMVTLQGWLSLATGVVARMPSKSGILMVIILIMHEHAQ